MTLQELISSNKDIKNYKRLKKKLLESFEQVDRQEVIFDLIATINAYERIIENHLQSCWKNI